MPIVGLVWLGFLDFVASICLFNIGIRRHLVSSFGKLFYLILGGNIYEPQEVYLQPLCHP
jgi:hypothetical protein